MGGGICRSEIVDQQNKGVSSARNSGLALAKGEFVCFVDADDIISPNYLEILLAAIKRYNCDCAISGFGFIRERTNYNSINFKKSQRAKKLYGAKKVDAVEDGLIKIYTNIGFGSPWAKIYRLEILKKLPNFPSLFNEKLRAGEDSLFNFEYFEKCNKLLHFSNKIYQYRRRSGSATSQAFNKKILRNFDTIDLALEKAAKKYKKTELYVRATYFITAENILHKMCLARRKGESVDRSDINFVYKILRNNLKYIKKARKMFFKQCLCTSKTLYYKTRLQIKKHP